MTGEQLLLDGFAQSKRRETRGSLVRVWRGVA